MIRRLGDMTRAAPPTDCGIQYDAAEALVVTSSLEETAAARARCCDSLFLLERPNALRDVAFAPASARPTYVAMDVRALEVSPPRTRAGAHEAVAISPRGRVTLRRPFQAPPHEVLAAVVSATWRERDRNRIMLTARAELWRDVELELRDYWNSWVDVRAESYRTDSG
jgi:hypothetical protein